MPVLSLAISGPANVCNVVARKTEIAAIGRNFIEPRYDRFSCSNCNYEGRALPRHKKDDTEVVPPKTWQDRQVTGWSTRLPLRSPVSSRGVRALATAVGARVRASNR